ncbi:hypothetical protein [Oceanicola sp. 22II-s10i]|uniref:hypothetical protein n=1 Tax=Oceanicola sp. 22II-s10i TaxID=1317116 RepID=UPI000B51FB86|nr:hypothetical protein [Oceanicola sp. 22II-s10i]
MFVPEVIHGERCILVHNHYLETPEGVTLAARFTRARIAQGRANLPPKIRSLEVIFDVRGQTLDGTADTTLTAAALGADVVTFMRG